MAEPATFVGRESELARLGEQYSMAQEGAGRVVLVGGEAGIGKTALVRQFLAQLGQNTAEALWGSSPVPSGGQIPYAPVVEILRAVEKSSPAALERLGPSRESLRPILPTAEMALAAPADDPLARIRLLDAIRSLLDDLATARAPLTLVLDDLQWADDATLEVLSYLTYRLRRTPLLLVGIYRSDEQSTPLLQRLLVELVRLEHVVHIELAGLGVTELVSLLRPADGLTAQHLTDFAQRAGGNPFFFRQLTDARPDSASELPESVRQLLLLRIEALPPAALLVCQVAAIAGRLASTRLIAAAISTTEQDVLKALRVLVTGAVLEPSPDGPRYSFRHPLLQEAVLSHLLPDERGRLHRAIGAALEADPTVRSPGPAGLVELAIHWSAADDRSRALPALLAGGEAAQRLYAFELAHEFFERALELNESDEMLSRAAETAYLAGRPERALELATRSLEGGHLDRPGEHLALERIGWYHVAAGDLTGALEAHRRAVQAAQDAPDAEVARVLASLGRVLMLAGQYSAARGVLEDAIERARRGRSAGDESRALTALGSVLVSLGENERAAASFESARRIDERRTESIAAPRPSRIGYVIGSLLDRAAGLEAAGQAEEAAVTAIDASKTALDLGGVPAWGGLIATTAARELFLLGRWAEVDEVSAQLGESQADRARPELDIVRARVATARGQFSTARALLRRALLSAPVSPLSLIASAHLALAELSIWEQRPEPAREEIDAALALPGAAEDRAAMAEIASVGLRADAARAAMARLRRAGGQVQAIREAALVLAARAGISPAASGEVDEGRAGAFRLLCHAELGRVAGSSEPDQWRSAADRFGALREPYNTALAQWREAEALLYQRADRMRAEFLLRGAGQVAAALGAAPLREEIETLARRSRIDLTGDAPPEAEGGALDELARLRAALGLSPRELEVLALVAEGMTNRHIGEMLFITEKTAEHHVSSILNKLGLSSRIEAAAVAHRHGLLDALSPATAT
jgi:DNA-binding CsgD family transcriptional regulator